jgi:hypothetical protein
MFFQMICIERLSVHARLDGSEAALARAREEAAEGDESWEQWVSEYENGDALTVCLDLCMEFAGNRHPALTASIGGFFVESDAQTPKVEQQVAELASGEFVALGERLPADAGPIDFDQLAMMYVHVDLSGDVRAQLNGHRT